MYRSSLLSFCAIVLGSQLSAQTLSSLPYCTPGYKNPAAVADMITSINVNAGAFTNGSGLYSNSTYVYYNNLGPIVMAKGSVYTIVLNGVQSTIGTTTAAWLDWNKDDSFDYFTELMDIGTLNFSTNWSETLSFTVPANADTGLTRLRLISYGSDNAVSILACPSGGQTTMSPERGEAEDYQVRIVSPTGIENVYTPALVVFPNPARDILNIQLDKPGTRAVHIFRIYDMTGREVLETKPIADGTINLSMLPAGSYLLGLVEDDIVVARVRVQVYR